MGKISKVFLTQTVSASASYLKPVGEDVWVLSLGEKTLAFIIIIVLLGSRGC